jgi:hypothetical protein
MRPAGWQQTLQSRAADVPLCHQNGGLRNPSAVAAASAAINGHNNVIWRRFAVVGVADAREHTPIAAAPAAAAAAAAYLHQLGHLVGGVSLSTLPQGLYFKIVSVVKILNHAAVRRPQRRSSRSSSLLVGDVCRTAQFSHVVDGKRCQVLKFKHKHDLLMFSPVKVERVMRVMLLTSACRWRL